MNNNSAGESLRDTYTLNKTCVSHIYEIEAVRKMKVQGESADIPVILSDMPNEVLPATARAISLLLASNPTIQDVHPGVLHQLLEFSHRYTYQVLSDALVYAEHAGRAGKVELEDVMLAIQARVGWELGGRVPKDVSIIA